MTVTDVGMATNCGVISHPFATAAPQRGPKGIAKGSAYQLAVAIRVILCKWRCPLHQVACTPPHIGILWQKAGSGQWGGYAAPRTHSLQSIIDKIRSSIKQSHSR